MQVLGCLLIIGNHVGGNSDSGHEESLRKRVGYQTITKSTGAKNGRQSVTGRDNVGDGFNHHHNFSF